MDKNDIISKIIKLELEITTRVLSDKNFVPTINDEYKEHRLELKKLREIIFPKNEKRIRK